jgi:NADH:ubiquinone reductase (H+-translocating)
MAFDYITKGMMASIGRRNGVGAILGLEAHEFLAWGYGMHYLSNLPTLQKKMRVMADRTLGVVVQLIGYFCPHSRHV